MSTDYEIRCACGECYGEDNWRTAQAVQSLIWASFKIAQVVRALHDVYLYQVELPSVFYFLEKHDGHDMTVWDEYGYKWPREGET